MAPVKERGFGLGRGRPRPLGDGGLPRAERAAPRRGGDRGHHELHQHLQPVGDAGRGPAGPEGGGARPEGPRLREDQPGPRLQGRHRVPAEDRPPDGPRGPGLRRGGLRLHHLHRQQRAPAAAGEPGRERGQARGLGRALGQPQLRGPREPRREGQLPGLAAAGGGLRPGRHHRHRPRDGADRQGQGRQAGHALRDLAHPEGSRGGGGPGLGRDVPSAATATSSTATRPGTR